MHGSIHVTSQQGKGSKFSLHLPIDCRKPGGPGASADDMDSAEQEAELQSTVNRLRALHHAEEEEDVIESHLLDKFERSFPLDGGNSAQSTSESDDNGARTRRHPGPGTPLPIFQGAASHQLHSSTVLTPAPSSSPRPAGSSGINGSPAKLHTTSLVWGAPLPPQHQQRREVSASMSSSSSDRAVGKSNSASRSGDVQVTFHDESVESSVNHSSAATQRPAAVVALIPPQVEGHPHGPVPVTSASPPMTGKVTPTTVAVDLLTASSTDPLSSNLLWPAGSSSSAPTSSESRHRHLATPVLSLLLVDDADVNLKILCKMLGSSLVVSGTKYKLHLTTASNGLDAMRKVEDRWTGHHAGFHAILSDSVMPLADGFQFAKLLREYERRNEMHPAPLVALTANALKADVDAYTAASFRWFVPKPFRRADLHGVLTTVLAAAISDPVALAAATPSSSRVAAAAAFAKFDEKELREEEIRE